jgi:hypothetical protein
MYDCPICGESLSSHPRSDRATPVRPINCSRCGTQLHSKDFFVETSLGGFFVVFAIIVSVYFGIGRFEAALGFAILYLVTRFSLAKHFDPTKLVPTTRNALFVSRSVLISLLAALAGIWIYALVAFP